MKKSIAVIIAIVVLGVAGISFAQMDDKGKEMMKDKAGMMEGQDGMMGKGMTDGKMMGMCPMMKSMMERSIVATNDGGVVVAMGNKLTKYDKDLNAVKEIELKMDMEGMQKMMKDCPMMGKGMMGKMDNDAGATAEKTAPAVEVDHASHH